MLFQLKIYIPVTALSHMALTALPMDESKGCIILDFVAGLIFLLFLLFILSLYQPVRGGLALPV
jgi:hypothetical protein